MAEIATKMTIYSFRVEPRHIGYIKWLLESHDGIATPTTREGTADIIDLLVAPDFKAEARDLIDALVEELGVEPVDTPDSPPLGG